MHISLADLERENYRKSSLHLIDGRVKILVTFAVIIYAVSLPRMELLNFMKLGILEVYIFALMLLARLELSYIALRFAISLPFGFAIAAFQPFVKQPFIENFTVLYSLPLGLEITREGMLFGSVILAKFTVCISAVILLSSTAPIAELVSSARRLGMPRELALLFTMMVRYLFVFWHMLGRIRNAQRTRCFDLWNKNVAKKWTLEQIGYTISSLFVRSYEQGERTYQSMLCRGYNDANVYVGKKRISKADVFFLTSAVVILAMTHLV